MTLTVSLGPKMAQVPTVVGFSLEKATGLIQAAGLPLGTTLRQFDDITPKDQVLAVSKDAGASVPDFTEIVLTVSDGPAPVAVPQEVGATLDTATNDLKNAGLKIASTEAFDAVVPAGHVVSQDPVQNTQAHRGDTVALVVSKGPEMVQVPNVYGMNVDTAKKTIEAAGLVVDTKKSYGGHLGTVVSQSIAAGQSVPKGSTITLTFV